MILLNAEHELHLNYPLELGFFYEIFCALYDITLIIVKSLIVLYLQFFLAALDRLLNLYG